MGKQKQVDVRLWLAKAESSATTLHQLTMSAFKTPIKIGT